MNHLSAGQRKELQETLLDEKASLQNRISGADDFNLGESQRDAYVELSVFDNHPADFASETFERGKDLALNQLAETQLDDINTALNLFSTGEYGICIVCHTEIPFERLQAVPSTRYCIQHTPDREVSDDRPVEEEVRKNAFDSSFVGDRLETNFFDGEDTWQILAGYGTSSTPAIGADVDYAGGTGDVYNDMYINANENDGYVEDYESFVATDIYGEKVFIVRNAAYLNYLERKDGEGLLEPDIEENE
jgi:YteA family regulatory protein